MPVKIGTISNFYGALYVKEENGKCYCGIENYDPTVWEEIPRSLYDELLKFEASRAVAIVDSASVDFAVVPRPEAQEMVNAVTIHMSQCHAVSFDDCEKLLGKTQFAKLKADPIRRLGPVPETVYPWNVVDYLSCENPRGKFHPHQKAGA